LLFILPKNEILEEIYYSNYNIKELENILKTCHIEEINFINSKLKKDSNSIVYHYFEPLEI